MNIKKEISLSWMRQALGKVWLIDETSAGFYANLLENILANNVDIKAGLFDDAELPYRANSQGDKTMNGSVLVLPIEGVMMKSDFCGDLGSDSKAKLLQAAYRDPSIKAAVLKTNSGGGSVAGTENFANTVKASPIPVVTWAELMGSAAYWVGSAAREVIISGETTLVGSIGTMAIMSDTSKRDEARGERKVTMFATRSIHKNRSAMEALEGKPENYIAEFLDPVNAAFENAVATNRKGKIDLSKEDVMTGKIYTGSKAIEVGLADKIGTLDYAIKRSLQLANSF